MQQRKQGGFTGVFGGGTQQDAAGGQWQRFSVLTKATIFLMALFLVTSLVLVLMH
jgi:preprotein translocase subunit SecG